VKTLELGEQQVTTKDKASLRIGVHATYRFVDAPKAVRAAKDPVDLLRNELRLALRAAVRARTLDALQDDESAINAEISAYLCGRFAEIGIEVRDIGVETFDLSDDAQHLRGEDLETLERITDKVGNMSVYGSLYGVLNELVRLKL
jgi:regulator of protease activity HflC (stomatin/prohibitin superfamily)